MSLCRYDIRFQFIMDDQTPSHMAFHRFIHDDLKIPIEEIFYDLNRYFEKNDTIDADILYWWHQVRSQCEQDDLRMDEGHKKIPEKTMDPDHGPSAKPQSIL